VLLEKERGVEETEREAGLVPVEQERKEGTTP